VDSLRFTENRLPRPTLRGTEEAIYGVYGGLIDKGMKALEALQSHDPVRAIEEAAPVSSQTSSSQEGIRKRGYDSDGRVKYGEDQRPMKLTAGESVSRAAGFRQAREAMPPWKCDRLTICGRSMRTIENHLKDRWLAADTGAEKRAVLLAVQAYNRSVLKFRGRCRGSQ